MSTISRGKKEYPVTDKWYESYSPVFSTDGKYLVFTSARDFNPTYSQTEWNHVYIIIWVAYIWRYCLRIPLPRLWKRMRR